MSLASSDSSQLETKYADVARTSPERRTMTAMGVITGLACTFQGDASDAWETEWIYHHMCRDPILFR